MRCASRLLVCLYAFLFVGAGLLLPWARPLCASPEEDVPEGRSVGEESFDALLAAALEAGIASDRHEALYRAAIWKQGDADALLARLAQLAGDPETPAARRHAALWVEAHMLRRSGRLREALARFEALIAATDALPAVLERAKVLDMLGLFGQAWKVWKAALPRLEQGAGERNEIEDARRVAVEVRLRMALLGRHGSRSVKIALGELGRLEGLDPALRNRAAIVLSLRGYPREALDLFVSAGVGAERFREQIRLADWALAAKDPARAQALAWSAHEAATLERDRRYALAVLVEAHRADKTIDQLLARLAAAPQLSLAGREVWIDLLRETGRVEEALRLFRASGDGRFTVAMRRELLEMCRESGDEDALIAAYEEMIAAEPSVTEWRQGLSRHYLERGRHEAARAVWASYLKEERWTRYLLTAADSLHGVGLDDLAQRFAEASIERGQARVPALLFLFALHKQRGQLEAAEKELLRFDQIAAPDAPERMQLAEAYEQLGNKRRAVEVLRALSDARGPERTAEDMEMRLAWLYSEVGDEEQALERWHHLWKRVAAVSRRRYVEDRMMNVASRLGKLADIAIELEEKLAAGTASARDGGLLTRLYTKAGDPVSATEVLEEYMRGSGAAPLDVLVEKSRIFLACGDYDGYERTLRQLIEADPEGRGDHLRQLAMSQLERGKPEDARRVLTELTQVEAGSDSAEFEAGVLALAGLREEAVQAYRRGLARSPDRIESLLLMTALMAQIGQKDRAVGMLQHIAETAPKDDLFMIAIDGLLNLDAPPAVLRWARRITLERLARRHDKMYLYQLIADLAEQTGEREAMLRALQGAVPIIGERRASLLRELMDHTRAARTERARHLAFGRRLIGLGEVAPPQVYLDLGRVFLEEGDIASALKTFSLATDVPDYAAFQQEVATTFESAGYPVEALRGWQRLLISRPGDVAALLKTAELQELTGQDEPASGLYARALELMLARRPLSAVVKEEDGTEGAAWYRARNVNEFERFHGRVLTGLLATMREGPAATLWLLKERALLADDLGQLSQRLESEEADKKARSLRAWPRVQERARIYRRVAIVLGHPELADELDAALLRALPDDESLLADLVRGRLTWGLTASARALIKESGRAEEERRKLHFLLGGTNTAAAGRISLLEANRLFLPLVVSGDTEGARSLLRRLDFSALSKEDQALLPVLQSAALQMADGRLALTLGRHWVRMLITHDKKPDAPMRFRPVLQRLRGLLDQDEYRSLCEYIVTLILKDPKQSGYWLQLLPEMQESFERPLLDEEQRKSLTENIDGRRWYWIGSLFPLIPKDQRSAVLRSALPKVPTTQRLRFVLRLVDEIKSPIEGDFAAFLLETFEAALEDIEQAPAHSWSAFINLARGVSHPALRLRLLDATIQRVPGKPIVRAARAVLLAKGAQRAEGLRQALAVLPELMGTKVHYSVRSARRALIAAYLPAEIDAFLQVVDAQGGQSGPSQVLTDLRIELVRGLRDPLALLVVYRKAAHDHPEEARYQRSLRSQLATMGYAIEALQLAQAAAAKKPEDEPLQKLLAKAWRRIGNPVQALKIIQALRAAQAEREQEQGGDAAASETKQAMWVSPLDIKQALDDGDEAEAGRITRRLWRKFQQGPPGGRAPFYFPNQRAPLWPREVASGEGSDSEQRHLRGGLAAFDDDAAQPTPQKNLYQALAGYDFGISEMERELRTWEGARLSGGGQLIDGIAQGQVGARGAAAAVRTLLRAAQAGRAGKREYGLLLSLFAHAPDEVLLGARPVLLELERTLEPTDVGQLRRLARAWARLGDEARAARIYRWCGTQASAGRTFFYRVGATRPVPTSELVEEVGEVLTGEMRDDTIEAILKLGDPGFDLRYGPSARDAYEALVLQTWIQLLGPEQAFERCREVCRRAADGTKMPLRRSAMLAAALLARAGETRDALRALEHAVCKLDPPAGVPAHQQLWYRQSGRIGRLDIRRLLPRDSTGWKNEKAWLVGVAEALPEWVGEQRVEAARVFEALAITLIRLAALGEEERARALLPTLETWASESARSLLWVADVARAVGAKGHANAVERRLFDEGRLNLHRVPEVIARIRVRDGAAAALKAGEAVAAYVLHPGLIAELIASAEAAQRSDRVTHWKQVAAEVERATAALEVIDDE